MSLKSKPELDPNDAQNIKLCLDLFESLKIKMPESLLTLFYSLFKQGVPADVLFYILFPSNPKPIKSGISNLPDLSNLRSLSSNLSSAKLSTENINSVAVNVQSNAVSIQNDSLANMLEQTKKINASLAAPLFGKK